MQKTTKFISNLSLVINQYLGWRNWAVLVYNSIIENTFILFYIALRQEVYSIRLTVDCLIFLLFSCFCTSYGYLINDLGDKELDKLHAKDNTFKDDSVTKASLIILFFLLLSVILSLRFIKNPLFFPFWLCWLGFSTAYSIRPFRLKERRKVGLIVVVIAQRVLPLLVLYTAFNHYIWVDWIVFTVYVFFRGLSSDLNHQLEDYHHDFMTETSTYAVDAGLQRAQKLFRASLESEKVLLFLCLLLIYHELPRIEYYGMSLVLPILVLYLFLYVLSWIKIKSRDLKISVNPFLPGRRDVFQFIHHGFPSVALPLYLILLLLLQHWSFVPILLAFIFLKRMYSLKYLKDSYPVKLLMRVSTR
jgi:4-hydroxybenzoate polyprenyltransferase